MHCPSLKTISSLVTVVTLLAACRDAAVGPARGGPQPPLPQLALSAPQNSAVFVAIDEDGIDNGAAPNFFSDVDVNDHIAEIGVRTPLGYFASHVGATIELGTGKPGDEGWFAPMTIPDAWTAAGPTSDGLRNLVRAGPGLGSANPQGDREALLDKVPGVTPLRTGQLSLLVGRVVCAVVWDGDIGINYNPLNGSLKGANLGVVAFEVVEAGAVPSSGNLPRMRVIIRDAADVCAGSLTPYRVSSVTLPPEFTIEVGDMRQPVPDVRDANGNPVFNLPMSWESSDPATVSADPATGLATGLLGGDATLAVTIAGLQATTHFIVLPPPAAVTFAPPCGSLAVGAAATLAATPIDADGVAITRPLTIQYASSDAEVASVDPATGVATGLGRGLATVSATVLGVSGTTQQLVYDEDDAIVIVPGGTAEATSLTLALDGESDLTGSFAGIAITAEAFGGCRTWSSDDDGVVSVTADGHITAVGAGTTTIRLTIGALSGSFPVEVELPPPPPVEEPPPGGLACDETGCIVHPPECQSSRAVDVNVHGEMIIHCRRRESLPSTALTDRAYYWDGVSPSYAMLDHADARACTPHGMNAHGQIVGHCAFPAGSGKTGGVYWSSPTASLQVLPNIVNPPLGPGGQPSIGTTARGINDAGVIVGFAPRQFDYPGSSIGFVWAPAAARWASPTSNPVTFHWNPWIGPSGTLYGVSPSGWMAGQSTVTQGYSCGVGCFGNADIAHAGRLAANAPAGTIVSNLGALAVPATVNNGLSQSLAYAVNDAGVAVGWTDIYVSSINNIRRTLVRWAPTMQVLSGAAAPGLPSTVSTLASSEASDINNAGWISGGWGAGTNTSGQAFVWKGVLGVPVIVLFRAANTRGARANALSELFQGPDGQMQAWVAGTVQVTTSTDLRAVRWLVRE